MVNEQKFMARICDRERESVCVCVCSELICNIVFLYHYFEPADGLKKKKLR